MSSSKFIKLINLISWLHLLRIIKYINFDNLVNLKTLLSCFSTTKSVASIGCLVAMGVEKIHYCICVCVSWQSNILFAYCRAVFKSEIDSFPHPPT